MAAKIAELETARPAFTAADKKQFAVDIKMEKKKIVLLAGAANLDQSDPEDLATLKNNVFNLLQEPQYQGEIKYAPLRIAVQDALVWAKEVEVGF